MSDEIRYGTFKTMNLNNKLLKNIHFVKTTPIQRKTIPKILMSNNITGIARTGSGKTYAYLIPIIQKILSISNTNVLSEIKLECNALILLPTRELAQQVYKVTQTLIKNTSIKIILLQGGVNIEKDFDKLAAPVNIIISTVGRIYHCLTEMNKKIKCDILCIDEMDRIFEEMEKDINSLLEEITYDQCIFFSATLPENIIPIINETEVIKIDMELSKDVQTRFLYVQKEEKEKALLCILEKISGQTMIFACTRYSVDYLSEIISIPHSKIYSSMDQQARQENLQRFTNKTSSLIIVTDLAARGLDIRELDNVIMYDFCDDKTFLHRIGRVGRCGRKGECFCFISYHDSFNFYNIRDTYYQNEAIEIGKIPQQFLDSKTIKETELKQIALNGEKKMKTFAKKIKGVKHKDDVINYKPHSYFGTYDDQKHGLLDLIRNFKKTGSIQSKKTTFNTEKDNTNQPILPFMNKNNRTSLFSSAYSFPADEIKVNERIKTKKIKGELFKKWTKNLKGRKIKTK